MGYKLSNNSYGVLFNDNTKIVMFPDHHHFVYIEKVKDVLHTEQMKLFNFVDYPQDLSKKVILLQHFKSYIDGNTSFKPVE